MNDPRKRPNPLRPGAEPIGEVLKRHDVLLFDGAMGTMFYHKGVFMHRAFEELNLTRPALVREVHLEYVAAGAHVVETNTYSANRFRLSAHGLADEVVPINRRGVELAREAAAGRAWVAGSIGPLGVRIEPFGAIAREEAREVFEEQARALAEAGVDLFIVETFAHLPEIEEALHAVRAVSDRPLVAQVTVGKRGVTREGVAAGEAAERMAACGADAVGVNCSEALATLEALEGMGQAVDLPLSGQPNAGQPRTVQGRNLYLASPDYLVAWARRALRSGVRILGGCCGTTPEHIRLLSQTISESEPRTPAVRVARPRRRAPAAEPPPTERRSALAAALAAGEFVRGVEMIAPIGWVADDLLEAARRISGVGARFLTFPEGSRAEARMPPIALARLCRDIDGVDPVVYFQCRERRLARMQSELLGAWATGVVNLVLVTGEPSNAAVDAAPDLDVDSIGAVNLADRLNHGEDLGGNPIGRPTGFHVGVYLDPAAHDREREVRRFYWKVDAGAEFAITAPIFDPIGLESLLGDHGPMRRPVIATIWPLVSAREAEFFEREMSHIPLPDALVARMQQAERNGREREEGLAIARELAAAVKPMVQGIQVFAQDGRLDHVVAVLEEL